MKFRKKEIKGFLYTFLVGIVAHFFIIANPLFNADGIFYNRSMGAGSILGRWLIEILNSVFSFIGYSTVIPMFNVVISILILSFSTIYLLRIFDIEDFVYRLIISCSVVLSPAVIQTFFYGFTSHIYAISILFTILSIYFLVIKNNFVPSVYLNCIALSIYQAYIPFMLCIYLIYIIKRIISNSINDTFKIVIKSFLSFFLSFVLYYMVNDIINRRNESYIYKIHGMSEYLVPKFTMTSLLSSILKCYESVFDMFLTHNVFAHNTTFLIRIVYFILIVYTIYLIIKLVYIFAFKKAMYYSERKEAICKSVIIILLYSLSPIAINFMFIMTNNGIGYIEDRLSLSLIFYIILPIVLSNIIDEISTAKNTIKFVNYKKIVSVLTIIILIHNVWLAYGSYYNQYKIINASKSFALELATNIKMLSGYKNDTAVLFIGSPYVKNTHFNYGYYVDAEHNLYSNFDIEYENILSEYPMMQIFKEFTALNFPEPDTDFAYNLYYSRAVREMPLYPADGSVQLVENVAVVKFKEPTY
ncbi:MAG: glucosyltransferase domain-containing protein [Lachnospiraceae bacterium]|nr:glucosyltransferase domain-containing protein [Lachnospiraceae bacterium]